MWEIKLPFLLPSVTVVTGLWDSDDQINEQICLQRKYQTDIFTYDLPIPVTNFCDVTVMMEFLKLFNERNKL